MGCCCTTLCVGFVGLVVFTLILSFLSSRRKTYSIQGKHLLITGGSSGIGKCIATHALKRGASIVTLVARNKDKLVSAKDELDQEINSTQCVNIISVDVGETESESKIIKAISGLKPVDVLINSAGIAHTEGFLQTGQDVFESIMRTNFMGTVKVTRAILPSMIDRQEGCIVLVSSQAAQFPMCGYTAYAPSKFALRGFAEVLQMEVKPYNISVMISYPPDTDTPQLEKEMKQRSPMVAELATYGTTFKPDQISSEILNGVEQGLFNISHGFDGFMLKTLTAGVSPVASLFELITQVSLTGLFRPIALWYLRQFNSIVCRNLKKTN